VVKVQSLASQVNSLVLKSTAEKLLLKRHGIRNISSYVVTTLTTLVKPGNSLIIFI